MVTEVRGTNAPSSAELGDEIARGFPSDGKRSRFDSALERAIDLTMLIALPALFVLAIAALVMPL